MIGTGLLPPTARSAVRAFYAAMRGGDVSGCVHLRRGGVPLAYWAMWAPSAFVCGRCLPMLALTGEEDRRCDHCGRIVPEIHPNRTVTFGLVILHGACARCERGGRKVPWKANGPASHRRAVISENHSHEH